MADWSQLPNDLLQKICQKLNNSELYLLRVRSVCSSWRRASIQNCHHNHLPSKLPQFPRSNQNNCVRRFPKQNIFLIKPPAALTSPSHHHRPWLIRIGPNVYGKTQIWHPFDVYLKHPLHFAVRSCHHQLIIDFNQMPVIHLGHMFYIHGPSFHYEKVVATTCEAGQPLAVLTYDDSDRRLKIFQCEGASWTRIPTMPRRSSWGDTCLFKGQPCVADNDGRTLMIRPEDSSVILLANPVFGGDIKFLVESECDLLLLDCYGIDGSDYDENIRFDVYRLDLKEKKWIKLTTLGDRVLFVEQQCSFSASASDLHVANGNCIIYSRNAIFMSLNNIQSRMRIFHLDQGHQGSRCLSDYPEYIKLFWPPPKWILELHNSDEFNLSEVIESDNERTNYDDDEDDDDNDDDDDDDDDDGDNDDDDNDEDDDDDDDGMKRSMKR